MGAPIVGIGRPVQYLLEWEDELGRVQPIPGGRTYTRYELDRIHLFVWPEDASPGDVEEFHKYLVSVDQHINVIHCMGKVRVMRARPVELTGAAPITADPVVGPGTTHTPLYGSLHGKGNAPL